MPRVLVLGNRFAGGGRGARAVELTTSLLEAQGHDIVCVVGQNAAAALVQAHALVSGNPESRPEAIVVVGGDGTVHLGIDVCLDTGIPLGVVPVGSGNDFAAALGIRPHQVIDAARLVGRCLDHGISRPVDAVRLTGGPDRAYGAILACGFDAVVNRRANGWSRIRSRLKYAGAVLAELPTFSPLRYRLQIDGRIRELEAMIVAVANTPSYGGGLRILPQARIDDGLLDVAILHPMSKPEFLRLFATLDRGTHVDHPRVEILQLEQIAVDCLSRNIVAFADGEAVGTLPLQATVGPHALEILTHPVG